MKSNIPSTQAQHTANLPAEFVTFWQGFAERHGGAAQAYPLLYRRLELWRADPADSDEQIPGYPEEQPPRNMTGRPHPHGWDWATLASLAK